MFFLSKLEWRSTFPGESESKREREKIREKLPLRLDVRKQIQSGWINTLTSLAF